MTIMSKWWARRVQRRIASKISASEAPEAETVQKIHAERTADMQDVTKVYASCQPRTLPSHSPQPFPKNAGRNMTLETFMDEEIERPLESPIIELPPVSPGFRRRGFGHFPIDTITSRLEEEENETAESRQERRSYPTSRGSSSREAGIDRSGEDDSRASSTIEARPG